MKGCSWAFQETSRSMESGNSLTPRDKANVYK